LSRRSNSHHSEVEPSSNVSLVRCEDIVKDPSRSVRSCDQL
jgi:hypothetical protein